MSSGVETVEIIDTWLWARLSGDDELMDAIGGTDNLVGTLAHAAIGTPYIAYFLSSSRDIYTVPQIRVQVDAIYTVKAVSEGATWSIVAPIARRIDSLLDGVNTTTPNGDLSCVREGIVQYPEVEQATQYRHLGGTYRFRANSH